MRATPLPLDVPEDLGPEMLASIPTELLEDVGAYDHDTAGGCG